MSSLIYTKFSIIAFPGDKGFKLVYKNEERTRARLKSNATASKCNCTYHIMKARLRERSDL